MKRMEQLYFALVLMFILGVRDGKVALWKENDPASVRIFPCRAAMLPEDARAALERGIEIDSLEQLEQLAENYLS